MKRRIVFRGVVAPEDWDDVNEATGKLNTETITAVVHGEKKKYPPCSLVFIGFARDAGDGSSGAGNYVFRPAQAADVERDSCYVTDLPGFGGDHASQCSADSAK